MSAEAELPLPLRTFLLEGVLRFTLTARGLAGISRISLIGSLTTPKTSPKDADVLVTVALDTSLDRLARIGRALKGHGQTRNSGADIFLASSEGQYIGRTCGWRECRAGVRLACRALHCGATEYLNDDLQVVNLSPQLVTSPPIDLWPHVVRRVTVPRDVEHLLLEPLAAAEASSSQIERRL